MKKRYIAREIEPTLQQAAAQFPAVVLTGARQTGKSTMLQHLFPDAAYVTLDDPFTQQAARDDPRNFLQREGCLIIDEIQYLPELLPYIKIAIDQERHRHGRFLLTGSQMFPLMAGVTESLAGRTALFRLTPFSCQELNLESKTIATTFEALYNGFYPDVAAHGVAPNLFYAAYVQTYLERDVRQITAVAELSLFQRLIELLAARVGGLLNYNEISKEAGVSTTTVRRWMSILESSGIIFLLRPYSRNLTSRIIKSPKIYFGDSGLVSWLLRYPTAETLRRGPQGGALFENFVALELFKAISNRALNLNLYFYRDSNDNEVDLVVESGAKTTLIEIKQSATPKSDHFKTIKKLMPQLPNSTGLVVCHNEAKEIYQRNMAALPWHLLLQELAGTQ